MMTIYYSKRDGSIKNYQTGENNMSYFGEDEEDFSIIYDFIIVELDEYILKNIDLFCVQDGKIKLKDNLNLERYL